MSIILERKHYFREFSEVERGKVITALKIFKTPNEVVKALRKERIKISASGVKKIAARYKKSGTVATASRCGRPKKTEKKEDRSLIKIARANRLLELPKLGSMFANLSGIHLSAKTVSRRLKTFGLNRRVAIQRPALNANQIEARLAFAMRHRNKPKSFWRSIKFSDEKIFSTANFAKRSLVTRSSGERYHPKCVQPTKRWGIQVHTWAIIGWSGVGPIRRVLGTLTAQKYQDEIIYDIADLCVQRRGARREHLIFQQDNARPHTAITTQQFLVERGVKTLLWPANSPDLNPIEHVWNHVARRVRARGVPHNQATLWQWVQEEWAATPLQYIRTLFDSMPSRMKAVVDNAGGNTRY